MAKKKLSDDKIRRCVFLQPYRKKGPDQFVREEPSIEIHSEGGDLPRQYEKPIVGRPDDPPPLELPQGACVKVRVFNEEAINPFDTGGTFGEGDLLAPDHSEAQALCDKALEDLAVHVLRHLSRY